MSTAIVTLPQTQEVSPYISPETFEKALVGGDLAGLTPEQRMELLSGVCKSLELNPLTRPFEYIELDGKLTLYARKDCTEQLRTKRSISVTIIDKQMVDGVVYCVTAKATTPNGRSDESLGAVPLVKEGGEWKTTQNGKRYFQGNGNFISLPPEAKANAMMKAETKAKRRVTLSICGLGMLDESEFDTIRNTRPIETPDETLSLRLSEETAKVEVMHSPKQLSPPASDQKPTRKPKAEEQIAPRLAELWAQCDSDIPGALTSINDEISGKVGDDDAERAWVNALKANKVANWEHMDVATAKKVVRDLWSYSIRVQREPVAEQ